MKPPHERKTTSKSGLERTSALKIRRLICVVVACAYIELALFTMYPMTVKRYKSP